MLPPSFSCFRGVATLLYTLYGFGNLRYDVFFCNADYNGTHTSLQVCLVAKRNYPDTAASASTFNIRTDSSLEVALCFFSQT
jgi:hypothetical protein